MCDLAAVPFALAGALAAFFVTPRGRAVREVARRRAAAAVVAVPHRGRHRRLDVPAVALQRQLDGELQAG